MEGTGIELDGMPPCNVMHRSHQWLGGGVIEKLKSRACGLQRVQSNSCHKGKDEWVAVQVKVKEEQNAQRCSPS